MEFGLFIQGYMPRFRQEVDPEAEHQAFMDELALVEAADRAGLQVRVGAPSTTSSTSTRTCRPTT